MSSASQRRPVAARLLALGLALGLAVVESSASRAQDKPDDGLGGTPAGGGGDERPVTDEMIRACPELKTATGRSKDQLLALYFELDWTRLKDENTRRLVASLFQLDKAEDAALLEKALLEKGPRRPQTRGLRTVVAAGGARGLVWALREFDKAPPEAKGNCLDLFFAARSKEAEAFLEQCLGDVTPVPDARAAKEAPPGYEALRICDHALRVLSARWESVEGREPPKGSSDVRSITPVARRDASIAAFKKWLAEDAEVRARLAKAPAALDGSTDDATKKEALELFKKLKLSKD